MIIKDPLTWMKSMCRNSYEARASTVDTALNYVFGQANFRNHPQHRGEQCPSPVIESRTTVRFQPTRPGQYHSLAHLWAEWNSAYLNVTFPRLIIRFEDILFDTESTVRTVCECVGGTVRQPFRQQEHATKTERDGHRGPVNDRKSALHLYGSEQNRYQHYTDDDLRFTANTVKPSGLLDLFHYDFRVGNTRRLRRLLSSIDRQNTTPRRRIGAAPSWKVTNRSMFLTP